MMKRRAFLKAVVAGMVASSTPVEASPGAIDVYKDPSCGCCVKWVEHLRRNGFTASVMDVPDLDAFKKRVGVPAALASCHTALIDGYVVEGHVPATEIRRLLSDRPKALGLAIPGMPAAAPGMDVPKAPGYDVLLFQADGTSRVYRSYPGS
jgi:hypothetical protein